MPRRITGLIVTLGFTVAATLTGCTTDPGSDNASKVSSTQTTAAPAPTTTAPRTNAVQVDPTTSPTPAATTASPSPSPKADPAQDPKIWKQVKAAASTKLVRSTNKTTAMFLYPKNGARIDGDNLIWPKVRVFNLKNGEQVRGYDLTDKLYPMTSGPETHNQLFTFSDQKIGGPGSKKHPEPTTVTLVLVAGDEKCMTHLDANAAQDGLKTMPSIWGCRILPEAKITVKSIRDGVVKDDKDHYALAS
jgi:hypothetical protein